MENHHCLMKKFNFATKENLFINVLVAKCIFSSVPPDFHNFLLRTLKVYEKSFHLKKKLSRFIKNQWRYSAMKFLLNCSTNCDNESPPPKRSKLILKMSLYSH